MSGGKVPATLRGPRRTSRSSHEPLVRRGRHRGGVVEPIDRLDVAILAALQVDGRASLRRVARSVGASVTTVSSRVRALERLGVLQGFAPLVSVQGLAALGRSPHCVVLYVVPQHRSRNDVEDVARSVARQPSVCYLFQMAGSSELMALASSVSPRATDRLVQAVSEIPGVAEVRPISIARVHKERPGHPVGVPAARPPVAGAVARP
jgi:Lrp/AsnC family transcriptional regulator, leucine-responsive regulatory protein